MSQSSPGADQQALADEVRELSARCEQHVRDAVGMALDGTIDTLPILDDYVRLSVEASAQRPELLPLLSRTVGVPSTTLPSASIRRMPGKRPWAEVIAQGWRASSHGAATVTIPTAPARARRFRFTSRCP